MLANPLLAVCVLVLSLLGPSAGRAATVAGSVEFVEGDVKITRGSADILPKVGETVQEGDTITTGKDGELHLRMEDQGFIAVRANTRMKIDGYRAEGDREDKSVISLFTGTFRSVTGWIGKYARKNYVVTTPTATLGIRGTDHEPLYVPEGAGGAEMEAGTYDKVNEGETFIQNPRGRVFIKPRQSGFVPHHGRAAPKLLKAIPKFFRPTRNESLIEKRREILRQHLEQRFKEKRRQLIEKRAKQQKAAPEKREHETAKRGEIKEKRKAERERLLQERKAQQEKRREKLLEPSKKHESSDRKESRPSLKERRDAERGEARRDHEREKQREEARRRQEERREAERN